jgi:hypothetical protein
MAEYKGRSGAENKPSIQSPDSDQLSDEAARGDEANEPRKMPLGGGAAPEPDPLRNPAANRNPEAPRQAGVTPRPTDAEDQGVIVAGTDARARARGEVKDDGKPREVRDAPTENPPTGDENKEPPTEEDQPGT